MQTFDFNLTSSDLDLTTEFMMLLGDEKHFNSDNFRKLGLHERFSDPQHEIGMFFAKLVANGVAVPLGDVASEIPSNNKRKVDLFSWNWKRWRTILRSRLP